MWGVGIAHAKCEELIKSPPDACTQKSRRSESRVQDLGLKILGQQILESSHRTFNFATCWEFLRKLSYRSDNPMRSK